ncbi:MAG: dockerin type I repeat-containing protein, partial [Saprospiraceae bacterium]|nr:dockerin type I repeat-containing protein [Saprospiraceae bacterium]
MEPSDFLDFDNVNNELYDLIINDPQGNILTNNILQYDVDTRTYEVQITEKSNGNKCWTSFSVSSFQTSHAIASCDEFVIASLTQTGHCVITPQSLDDGSSNFVSMWSSKTEFNCDDVNITQTVKLSVANSDNIISQCSSNIKIQDKLAPIVLMKNNPTVHLNGITPTQLTPDMVASYFDNCEFVSLQVVPSTIDCNSANPTEVTLIAKDKGGSTVSASTFVGYTVNSSSILSCNDEVEIEITGLDSVRITPEMLLEGNYTCDDNFDVTLSFNNFEFPLPVVTQSDIGKNLTFEVKNTTIGNSCWGSLIVKKPVDCTIPFVVCDTRCSEGVPGDCNSGYTVTDNIDWPCDFESYVCDDDLFERFSPGDLVALHGIPKEQVYPQIINYPCSAIFTDFADQYEPIGNANSGEKKVIRTWTVLDWMTGNTYTYVQEFYLLSGHSVICDVFPWDTPFGDCASGHTDQDAVEWPADITVSRGGIAINILRNNPNIHINNVEPRIMASCNFNYIVSYTDQFNQTDPDSITVKRTWKVEDNFTNDEVTFIQKITITGQSANQNVCAATFTGIPISDVDMQLGTTTESGCADIVFAPNFEIKPSKVSKAKEGVDIMDLVMVYEHILGLRELNSYQKIAADVTNSGYISTLDLVMMQRIVDGTANDWSLVPVWKFLDKNHTVVNGVITPFKESINTNDLLSSNQFLGIKMGDIDGSYRDPGTSRPITYAALKGTDDVLNKGETYELILKSDRSQSLVAAQLEFDIKDKGINIIGVEGNNLPGFDPTQHVKMSNDKLIIQWYIDLQKNPLGINILNNQEMV